MVGEVKIKLLIITFIFLFTSCIKQYECTEYQVVDTIGVTDEPVHVWFIYSKKEYKQLMDSSHNGKYKCVETGKLKVKK